MELLSNPNRELDVRENDGITVRLMLVPETNQTYVTVDDQKLNGFHVVDVPKPELAYDVFHHPFPYITESGGLAIGGVESDYIPDQAA